jgi:hypothetical protein
MDAKTVEPVAEPAAEPVAEPVAEPIVFITRNIGHLIELYTRHRKRTAEHLHFDFDGAEIVQRLSLDDSGLTNITISNLKVFCFRAERLKLTKVRILNCTFNTAYIKQCLLDEVVCEGCIFEGCIMANTSGNITIKGENKCVDSFASLSPVTLNRV